MAGNGSRPLIFGIGLLVVVGVATALLFMVLHVPPPLPPAPQEPGSAASPKVNIDVYIDGSQSMRQFLLEGKNRAPETNYLRLLLEGLSTRLNSAGGQREDAGKGDSVWSSAPVRYWKFGAFKSASLGSTSKQPLQEKDLRALADNPGSGFNATRTPIEEPVKDAQAGPYASKLKIIVTDLYQSGGDTGTYANPLANRYLDDEKSAVAIFAVRNPFAGQVDDLPGCGTLADAADSMPFYLIVAGPAGDVRYARAVLRGAAGLSSAIADGRVQEWYFSKAASPVSSETHAVDVRIVDRKSKLWRDLRSLQPADFPRVSAATQSGLTVLTMRKEEKAEVRWTPRPEQPQAVTVSADPAWKLRALRSTDSKGHVTEDAAAASAIVSSCHDGSPLCFTIDDALLEARRNYLFEIDAMARPVTETGAPAALQPSSATMKLWNIEVNPAKAICQARSFPGKKGMTPQLSQFLVTLHDTMLNAPVRTATYSLYVKAR